MREVQILECHNRGAFIMSFAAKSAGHTSHKTGTFPVGQKQAIDLSTAGIPEGTEVWPAVDVVAGGSRDASDRVVYRKNGATAEYSVRGTTFDIGIELKGTSLPGFPAGIPVTQATYQNWSRELRVDDLWTCTPRDAADVVTLCNWAQANGFRVRPRGKMHNWSPISVAAGTRAVDPVLMVDTTKHLTAMTFLPADGSGPDRVRVQMGATLEALLTFLEGKKDTNGVGYGFPNTPGPGQLTMGGVLAIGGHGTSVLKPGTDAFAASYGSMSDQILAFTAVVTDPASSDPSQYRLRTFTREESDAKAFMVHLGRAFIVDATLQVVDNFNLRCVSYSDIPAKTVFQAPTAGPAASNSFQELVNRFGRVEIIWFPFADSPWVHTWSVAPTKPAESREVAHPYNYPFMDPGSVAEKALGWIVGSPLGKLTPDFNRLIASQTASGLDGKDLLGGTKPQCRDIWGPSKNTLLYVEDSTLKVTANGYVIQMKASDLQVAVHDYTVKVQELLATYAAKNQFPINAAMELRVNSLERPDRPHGNGSRPEALRARPKGPPGAALSAISYDEKAAAAGWDVALWINLLTIPGTPSANAFYMELESWLMNRFSTPTSRILPEWTKGWAYTAQGPWTDGSYLARIRALYTDGRAADHGWAFVAQTLAKYDGAGLFRNAFLDRLFGGTSLPLDVLVHLQDLGDVHGNADELAGTVGQSRRLEGFQIAFSTPIPGLGIEYMAHVQDVGDTQWVPGGQYVGTRGQSKRLEGFAIRLTGSEAAQYSVMYMAHVQDIGDTPTLADGEFCGTRGQSKRVEALRVGITRK